MNCNITISNNKAKIMEVCRIFWSSFSAITNRLQRFMGYCLPVLHIRKFWKTCQFVVCYGMLMNGTMEFG